METVTVKVSARVAQLADALQHMDARGLLEAVETERVPDREAAALLELVRIRGLVAQMLMPPAAPHLKAEDLEEIMGVMAKASPAPWRARRTQKLTQAGKDALTRCHGPVDSLAFVSAGEDLEPGIAKTVAVVGDGPASMENAEFIAMAREAVPYLAAEVLRLRSILLDLDVPLPDADAWRDDVDNAPKDGRPVLVQCRLEGVRLVTWQDGKWVCAVRGVDHYRHPEPFKWRHIPRVDTAGRVS